jgi:DNA end-binding protein Ku
MGDSDKAAIASFVMRGKEYLAAVRADGDLLALETLFFADEVREAHQQISNLPGRVKLTRPELRMARQLIESMTGPWRPSDYRDTYTDRVNKLIEAREKDRPGREGKLREGDSQEGTGQEESDQAASP